MSKKFKRLRSQLRASGLDPKARVYDYDAASVRRANPYQLTIILTPQCGRKVYKELKRIYDRA